MERDPLQASQGDEPISERTLDEESPASLGHKVAESAVGYGFPLKYAALAAILLTSLAIMGYRASDPFGGFHGFNEAFYALLAKQYAQLPLYQAITSPLDYNNPPLFAMLLTVAFKLFGGSEAIARSVPILFSLLSVLFTYLLGRQVYSERVGLIAAALLGVSPGFVLVGRNVQVDSVFVFFMLASLYFYIDSAKRDSIGAARIAGIFLGLGFLGKLPAILLPAAIIIWHTRRKPGLSWIDKRFITYAASAIFIGTPWYLYQMIANRDIFLSSQSHLAGTLQFPNLEFLQTLLIRELFWALSPLIFILAIGSIIYIVWTMDNRARIILYPLAAFLVFYLFYHYHSYYILPLIPLSLLLVGVMLDKLIKDWKALTALTAVVMSVSVIFSIAMLCGHEYGDTSYAQAAEVINSTGVSSTVLEVTEDVRGSYGKVFEYYLPGVEVRSDSPENFPKDRQVFWLLHPKDTDPAYLGREGVFICYSSIVEPVLFGRRLIVDMKWNPHFFGMNLPKSANDASTIFGFVETEDPSALLIDWTKCGTPSQNEVVW